MANIYNEEVREADRRYQSEPTVQNELALEKAKLKFWNQKLKEDPHNKDAIACVRYHQSEVERLEGEVKIL